VIQQCVTPPRDLGLFFSGGAVAFSPLPRHIFGPGHASPSTAVLQPPRLVIFFFSPSAGPLSPCPLDSKNVKGFVSPTSGPRPPLKNVIKKRKKGPPLMFKGSCFRRDSWRGHLPPHRFFFTSCSSLLPPRRTCLFEAPSKYKGFSSLTLFLHPLARAFFLLWALWLGTALPSDVCWWPR